MFSFHLEESKYRFLITTNSVILVTVVIVLFLPDLILLVNYNLISFSLETTMVNTIYLALISAIYINIPFLIVEIYLFIKPSLFKNETFVFKTVLLWILLIWILGITFIPSIIDYLVDFNNETILFLPSITDLVTLVNQIFIVWVFLNTTPLIVYFHIRRKIIWIILNLVGILVVDIPFHILLIFSLFFVLEFSFSLGSLLRSIS